MFLYVYVSNAAASNLSQWRSVNHLLYLRKLASLRILTCKWVCGMSIWDTEAVSAGKKWTHERLRECKKAPQITPANVPQNAPICSSSYSSLRWVVSQSLTNYLNMSNNCLSICSERFRKRSWKRSRKLSHLFKLLVTGTQVTAQLWAGLSISPERSRKRVQQRSRKMCSIRFFVCTQERGTKNLYPWREYPFPFKV